MDEDEEEESLAEQPEDPNAAKRFWFEHATGAGKTVAALGLRGGIADRRHPDPHAPAQPRRPVPRRAARRAATRGASPGRCYWARTRAKGPVTVETYQWFVRNAGRISSAYTIVICDEAHTALGEKTSGAIRDVDGPDLHRHDRHGRADRAPRHRPVPDADLALRPRPGGPPRGDLAAALRAHPARRGGAHDRQGAAAPRRGGHRVRPGRAGASCSTSSPSTWRWRTSTRRASTACPGSCTRRGCATPTTSRKRSARKASRRRPSRARRPSASWRRSSRATSAATSTC